MIATNENLPDIEKLGRQEFILDTEDYQRMLQEEEKLIAAVREEIEFANLAAMFLRYRIKRDCWDNMVVKGRTIKVLFQSKKVGSLWFVWWVHSTLHSMAHTNHKLPTQR